VGDLDDSGGASGAALFQRELTEGHSERSCFADGLKRAVQCDFDIHGAAADELRRNGEPQLELFRFVQRGFANYDDAGSKRDIDRTLGQQQGGAVAVELQSFAGMRRARHGYNCLLSHPAISIFDRVPARAKAADKYRIAGVDAIRAIPRKFGIERSQVSGRHVAQATPVQLQNDRALFAERGSGAAAIDDEARDAAELGMRETDKFPGARLGGKGRDRSRPSRDRCPRRP
jgi:hypothetical protein